MEEKLFTLVQYQGWRKHCSAAGGVFHQDTESVLACWGVHVDYTAEAVMHISVSLVRAQVLFLSLIQCRQYKMHILLYMQIMMHGV